MFVVASNSDVYESGGQWTPGSFLLVVGPLGPLHRQFGWYANPLLLIALICICVTCFFPASYSRTVHWLFFTGLGLSVVATLLAFTSLFAESFPDTRADGGGPRPITKFGIGLYAWLSSFGSFVIGSLISLIAFRFERLTKKVETAGSEKEPGVNNTK
jgi:hypothetical protein